MTRRDDARGVAWRLFDMIEQRRTELGWTQDELSARSGVRRATISGWRTATKTRPAAVRAVAEALGLDVADALRAARGEAPAEQAEQRYDDPNEQAIWDLTGLTEDQRKALIASLRALRELDQERDQRRRSS